jgi:hypothetical protein
LGEVKVSVTVSKELPKLVDRCLALIPSMVSSDFNKEKPFEPLAIDQLHTLHNKFINKPVVQVKSTNIPLEVENYKCPLTFIITQ